MNKEKGKDISRTRGVYIGEGTQIRVEMEKVTEIINGRRLDSDDTVRVVIHEEVLIALPYRDVKDLIEWLYEETKAVNLENALSIIWRKDLDDEEKRKVRILRNFYLGFLDGKVEPLINISRTYLRVINSKKQNMLQNSLEWLWEKTREESFRKAFKKVTEMIYRSSGNSSESEENYKEGMHHLSVIEEAKFELHVDEVDKAYREVQKQ